LEKINKAAGELRTAHYKYTLPWYDNGIRLLPTSKSMEYYSKIGEIKDRFYHEVQEFMDNYDDYIEEAKITLHNLYNPKDYPSREKIAEMFEVKVLPITSPKENDFRSSLTAGEIAVIKADMEQGIEDAFENAKNAIWDKMEEAVERMASTLKEKGKVFKESMVENLKDIVEMVPDLNFTGDTDINAINQRMKDHLAILSPSALRHNEEYRENAAVKARTILDDIRRAR